MSLSNYKAPSHTFDTKGGSITVTGLSLADVSILVNEHLPDIESVFELFAVGGKLEDSDIRKIATSVVSSAPGLAANIIALGAGDYKAAPVAATLPAPLQINIIQKIGDLTFSEVGGVKKGMESITGLVMERLSPTAKESLKKMVRVQ